MSFSRPAISRMRSDVNEAVSGPGRNGRTRGLPPSSANWLKRAPSTPMQALRTPSLPPALPALRSYTEAWTADGEKREARRLLVVDSRLPNLADVVAWAATRAGGDLKMLVLDPDVDGLSQIERHVRKQGEIDLLMIAAANERGRLTLGCTTLTVSNLFAFEDELHRIGAALSPSGRICVLGRAGRGQWSDTPLQVMLSRLSWAAVEFNPMSAGEFLSDHMRGDEAGDDEAEGGEGGFDQPSKALD